MNVRRALVAAFGALAGCLVLAAAAFACTNLATLQLSGPAGSPGEEVAVNGSGFRGSPGVDASSPVILRWDSVKGAILGETEPDAAGNISATFTVPSDRPGHHVILATQGTGNGRVAVPARAEYRLVSDSTRPAVAGPVQPAVPAGSGSSTELILLSALLGASGLVLLAAGVASFGRHAGRGTAPVPVRVVRR